tara:strand:+ start:268 stop:1509 length:1242 start_codon:yes stop_codon:yes gene_type:complete
MADLFQIGYGGGPPKAIDYSKALDPLAEKITTRVKESKAKTDVLINNMPQGVPIDKVPEQLRGQVTDFLTKNKQAYVDASKVIASGIPSSDQRYIDAVATINQVDAKFKNLSNTLEDIALKRQAALDGREHGKGSLSWQISDHEDLANGTMYDNMIIQDDGGFNYRSNDNVEKRWADYSNTFQTSSVGTDSFYNLNDSYTKAGQQGTTIKETRAREQFRGILNGLKTDGARDFMFSDREFLATKIKAEFGTDEYNNELDKLVNSGNTETLLKEFEDFKVKQLTTSNTNGVNQYNQILNQKNQIDLSRSLTDGTYANDTRVREYMRNIKNNRTIVFGKDEKGNVRTYQPVRGGYQGPDGVVMTKQKMADLIGVPGDDLSTDLTNPLNDGNKRRSSGGNSGIKERDVRDVQQIKG